MKGIARDEDRLAKLAQSEKGSAVLPGRELSPGAAFLHAELAEVAPETRAQPHAVQRS